MCRPVHLRTRTGDNFGPQCHLMRLFLRRNGKLQAWKALKGSANISLAVISLKGSV